jgi:hypothetical protein
LRLGFALVAVAIGTTSTAGLVERCNPLLCWGLALAIREC